MKIVQKFLNVLIYGYKHNSDSYIKHLKKVGMEIGEGSVIFNSKTTTIDETNPYMIKIGSNVQITGGCTILSHDYCWAVTKAVYGDIQGSVRQTTIGDNVYIGMNSIILAGSVIGNNVIIGANSTVSGNIPDNTVAVGTPCRPIYTLEEYHNRRKGKQLEEAVSIAKHYYNRYGKIPPEDIFDEHFWLWRNAIDSSSPKRFLHQNSLIKGSESKTEKAFKNHNLLFRDYDEFISFALKERMENI